MMCPEGLVIDQDVLIDGKDYRGSELLIPEGVVEIRKFAFYRNGDIASVTLPKSLRSIGMNAFAGCISLTKVVLPEGGEPILVEADAFDGCPSLPLVEEGGLTYFGTPEDPYLYALRRTDGQSGQDEYRIHDGCRHLASRLFQRAKDVKKIVLPDSVTSIGDYAFHDCPSLLVLRLSENLRWVGRAAFDDTDDLSRVKHGNGLYLGTPTNPFYVFAGFADPDDPNVEIHEECRIVDSGAFTYGGDRPQSLVAVASLHIPAKVCQISCCAHHDRPQLFTTKELRSLSVDPDNPFYDSRGGCDAIIDTRANRLLIGCANTRIPEGIVEIGDSAFYECEGLLDIGFPESLRRIGWRAFEKSGLSALSLPEGLEAIEPFAFAFSSVRSMHAPSNLIRVGDYAFHGCKALLDVTLSPSVVSLGKHAFEGCDNMKGIAVEDGNPIYDGRGGCDAVIETKEDRVYMFFPFSRLPSGLKAIGEKSFFPLAGSVSSSLRLPEGVERIMAHAFDGYVQLEEVVLPSTLKVVEEGAFVRTGLKRVDIPEGVERIEKEAFASTELQEVVIPKGVRYLSPDAFSIWRKLSRIEVVEGNPVYDSREGCNAVIETATGTLVLGTASSVIPSGVKALGKAAFRGCGNLRKIVIPEGVEEIGDHCFEYCENLREVVLPRSLKRVGEEAFDGCYGLKSVTYPGDRNEFKKILIGEGNGRFVRKTVPAIAEPSPHP